MAAKRPLLMGIVNATPDSFSDGGLYHDGDAAVARGRQLYREGADIIDVGGESTRPGATPTTPDEELKRIVPVVRGLADAGIPVSVDTRKTVVMEHCLKAGAVMINDVSALSDDGAVELVSAAKVWVVLMHMRGDPTTMQNDPRYNDVVGDVCAYLAGRIDVCIKSGMAEDRLIVDPGIGFGKTAEHNRQLLASMDRLCGLGYPVLIGVSRKRFIAAYSDERLVQEAVKSDDGDRGDDPDRRYGKMPHHRLSGSLAAALFSIARGARIVRVHDVAESRQAISVWQALSC